MTVHIMFDAMNLMFRAVHTTGHLTGNDGRSVGAAWGFLRCLMATIEREKEKDVRVHVVWDGGRSRRRKTIYPGYKANRRIDPDDHSEAAEKKRLATAEVLSQAELVRDLLDDTPVCQYKADYVEADDIIAVLANALAPEETVVIISGDDDFIQLVRKGVIVDQQNGDRYSENVVPRPLDFLSGRCLMGDKSDGIAGIPQVGEARASLFLNFIRDAVFPFESENKGVPPEQLVMMLRDPSMLPEPRFICNKTIKAIELILPHVETVDTNRKLMDLRLPVQWEEVLIGAMSGTVGCDHSEKFFTRVKKLGWFGLEPFFASMDLLRIG